MGSEMGYVGKGYVAVEGPRVPHAARRPRRGATSCALLTPASAAEHRIWGPSGARRRGRARRASLDAQLGGFLQKQSVEALAIHDFPGRGLRLALRIFGRLDLASTLLE